MITMITINSSNLYHCNYIYISPLISDITIKKNKTPIPSVSHLRSSQVLNLIRRRQKQRLGHQQQLSSLDGAREHQASSLGRQQDLGGDEETLEVGGYFLGCWQFVWGIQMFFFGKWGKYSIAP